MLEANVKVNKKMMLNYIKALTLLASDNHKRAMVCSNKGEQSHADHYSKEAVLIEEEVKRLTVIYENMTE